MSIKLNLKHQAAKKAFSLIEVMVAIAILSIVLASMLGMFSKGYRYLRKSRIRTTVIGLTRQFMEEYSDWNRLVARAGFPPANGTYTNPPNPVNYPITSTNNFFTPQLVISNGPINPNQLKRLDIAISWIESGVNKNFTISTLKANY